MSKHSLNIAVKYGESLREFRDQSEAEDYYISYKDDLLNRLKAISTQASAFFPDYTIESLKKLTPFSELCTHEKPAYKYTLQAADTYFIIEYIN